MASKKDLFTLTNKELKRAGYPGLRGKKRFWYTHNTRESFIVLMSELRVKKGEMIGTCDGGNFIVDTINYYQPIGYWLPYLEIEGKGGFRCSCCPVAAPRTYEEIYNEEKSWLEKSSPNLLKHGFAFFDKDGKELGERRDLEKLFKPITPPSDTDKKD